MAVNNDYDEDALGFLEDYASSPDKNSGNPALEKATRALPRLAFRQAMTSAQKRLFERDHTVSLVVIVPSDDWVDPIADYLRCWAQVERVIRRSKPEKFKLANDVDTATLIDRLAPGQHCIAVSSDPAYLPAAVMASADIEITLARPDNKVLAHVIRLATGKRAPKLPEGIAGNLGFTDIVTAIRMGSTPRQCVDRLQRAANKRRAGKIDMKGAPDVEDLHGYGPAKDWAMALLDDLKRWRAGEIAFDDMERHAVLASAPGLGKTSLARSLAKSARLPLVTTSVAEWFAHSSGHLDGVIKQIDDVFRAAAVSAPAVLFMDEIDALPDRRGLNSRNRDWWMPVINHMLAKLDGTVAGDAGQLIILAATNHADRLDPALVRPGRLSRIIHIGLPDAEDLQGIFRQHLGNDLADSDLTLLAQLAWGSTGADVMGFVKTARRAARQDGRPLRLDDLMAQVAPPEKRSATTLKRIAIHEAAHAVVAHAQGLGDIRSVSLIERGASGGHTAWNAGLDTVYSRSDLEAIVRINLAGHSAETVFYGEASTGSGGHPRSDLASATQQLALMHGAYGLSGELAFRFGSDRVQEALMLDPVLRQTVNDHLKRLHSETVTLVKQHRKEIERVAEALLKHRYLNADAFRNLMQDYPVSRAKASPLAGGIDVSK
ncbi:AAA family ATPase [Tepidicaulis sp. LMO-SS28]|uniref:AAA family ATPase n=1 Tax=Tepidicaulis sp. LMO-SS28 TaxID=3447455 RepID=UPI003EE37FC9